MLSNLLVGTPHLGRARTEGLDVEMRRAKGHLLQESMRSIKIGTRVERISAKMGSCKVQTTQDYVRHD